MKFQSFLDFANRMFQYYYRPTQNLSVNWTLLATRGCTSMLQYIPTKRAKFGVKFWVVAESTKGTSRANRPMPNLIKTANLAPGQSLYIRQGDVLVIAYKGKGRRQPVRMLSTGITARDENGIPALITGYNRNMGGVDESDMLMSFYNAGRKSLKIHVHLAGEHGRMRGPPPAGNRVRQRTRRLDKITGRKQRDCCVCSKRRQGRRRSRYECSVCRRGCHKACWPHHACHEE